MPIEGLTANSFNTPAILIKSGSRQSRREAPLGLLLNRIRRMRIDKGTDVQIVYGSLVFKARDIEELVCSDEYEAWLKAPRVHLQW